MYWPYFTCSISHTHTHIHIHIHTQLGLSALATHSLSDFEEVIVRVAQSPGLLKSLRHHLSATTTRAPLFNTHHFERDISRAYAVMWEVEAALPVDFHHNSGTQTPRNTTDETVEELGSDGSQSASRKQRFHVVVGRGQGGGGGEVVQFGSPSSRHSWSIVSGVPD